MLERIAREHIAKGETNLPTQAALFAEWRKILPKETKSPESVYVKFKKVYGAVEEYAAAVGLHKLIMRDVSRRTGASPIDSAMLTIAPRFRRLRSTPLFKSVPQRRRSSRSELRGPGIVVPTLFLDACLPYLCLVISLRCALLRLSADTLLPFSTASTTKFYNTWKPQETRELDLIAGECRAKGDTALPSLQWLLARFKKKFPKTERDAMSVYNKFKQEYGVPCGLLTTNGRPALKLSDVSVS